MKDWYRVPKQLLFFSSSICTVISATETTITHHQPDCALRSLSPSGLVQLSATGSTQAFIRRQRRGTTGEFSRSTRRSGDLSGQATWIPARHRPMESRPRVPAVMQLEKTVPQAVGHPLGQLQALKWVGRVLLHEVSASAFGWR